MVCFPTLASLISKQNFPPIKGKHGKKNKLLEKRGGRKCYLKGYQTTSFSNDIIYSLQYPKYIWDWGQECKKKKLKKKEEKKEKKKEEKTPSVDTTSGQRLNKTSIYHT